MTTAARVLLIVAALGVAPSGASQDIPSTPLAGGGQVSIQRQGDSIRVAVTGPRAGLASLCVGDESLVRILHASAAVGEATYQRDGDRWILKSRFEWKLRDSPRTGPPSEADTRQALAALGWVANASSAGAPQREFTIRLSDRTQFLGVTFFSTAAPEAVSYWPERMNDDCRLVKMAQGFLPDAAQFHPSAWHRIR